jgi:hypothetical protein
MNQSMRALIRQRPWLIIVAVKVLFVTWWIAFVVYASRHAPAEAGSNPPAHGRH